LVVNQTSRMNPVKINIVLDGSCNMLFTWATAVSSQKDERLLYHYIPWLTRRHWLIWDAEHSLHALHLTSWNRRLAVKPQTRAEHFHVTMSLRNENAARSIIRGFPIVICEEIRWRNNIHTYSLSKDCYYPEEWYHLPHSVLEPRVNTLFISLNDGSVYHVSSSLFNCRTI
jgi:hypothetical protein